jgi:beta-glucosidase-like glycosyl hydrolase
MGRCSYNSINGVPSCANKPLLDHARVDWGFQGYITSDCGAVEDVYDTHHYVDTAMEAVTGTCSGYSCNC